eukprot:TRINITY_DN1430_c0_g3_i2.p1 TRINITY_DN1430_c0_g3~~TRINITY_DN1430_c0_g3_i2.p1  ORF type:complete len:534 (+),score=53.53 TRINITY_DN1430_c0_g3_i2:174-1604(+)
MEMMAKAVRRAMFSVSSQCDKLPRAVVLRRYVQGNKYSGIRFEISESTAMGYRKINIDTPYTRVCHIAAPEDYLSESSWATLYKNWVTDDCTDQHGDGPSNDYCCEGFPMTAVPEKATKTPQTCQILVSFINKNRCCGQLATFLCITCKKPFCGSCHLKHIGHNTRLVRSPCPQLTVTDDGSYVISSSGTYLSCEKCKLTCCFSCISRYRGMLVVENIPITWCDGAVVEALEEVFNCRISKYERSLEDGHMYIAFSLQVVKLRTQCIKLIEQFSGTVVLVKPPHYGRSLDLRELRMTLCLEFVPTSPNFELMNYLVRVLSTTGLLPVDIRYAATLSVEAGIVKLLIFCSDHRSRTLVMSLNNSVFCGSYLKVTPTALHRSISSKSEYTFHKDLNAAWKGVQQETPFNNILANCLQFQAGNPFGVVDSHPNVAAATQTSEAYLLEDQMSNSSYNFTFPSYNFGSMPRMRVYSKTPPF